MPILIHALTIFVIVRIYAVLANTFYDDHPYSNQEESSVNCRATVNADGHNATIRCNFNIDVNATKHSFLVESQRSRQRSFDRPDRVVECHWRKSEILNCTFFHGFKLNYMVSNHITVEIPKFNKRFEGTYICRTVPPTRPVYACNLTTEPQDTSTSGGHNGLFTSTDQTNLVNSTHSSGSSEENIAGLRAALVFLFLLLGMLIAAFVYIIRIRRKYKRLRHRLVTLQDQIVLANQEKEDSQSNSATETENCDSARTETTA